MSWNYRQLQKIIVVTVALDRDAEASIATAAAKRGFTGEIFKFDLYPSEQRRPAFVSQARHTSRCIAFVNFDKDASAAATAVHFLIHAFAGRIMVVAVSSHNEPEMILKSMRSGCAEFINTPIDPATLDKVLERVGEVLARVTEENLNEGSVISLIGAKGGVGTTSLAVHLAMYLAQLSHRKVLLVDAQPQLGHACVYLGLDGSRSRFDELVRNVHRLDSDLLSDFVARHASGLHVLSSADTASAARGIDGDAFFRTIAFLRAEYDYVIVDTPGSAPLVHRALIDQLAHFYLIGTPEVSAIRDLSRYLDSLTADDVPSERAEIIINRSTSRYAIDPARIEKAMNRKIAVAIPNSDAELAEACNLGSPIDYDDVTEFSREVARWAKRISSPQLAGNVVEEKKGLLSRWW